MNSSFQSDTTLKDPDLSENIKVLLNKILKAWWVFAISAIICLGGAYIYLKSLTPMYTIHAKLLVEDEKKGGGSINPGELLGGMSSMLDLKSNVDNEIEILKTRAIAEKAVRRLNLNITYYTSGTFKNIQLDDSPFVIDVLGSPDSIKATFFDLTLVDNNNVNISYKDPYSDEKINSKVAFGQSFTVKNVGTLLLKRNPLIIFKKRQYYVLITSLDKAINALRNSLNIAVTNKLVTTIDLNLNYPLPNKGEDILNKLIEGYLAQNIADKNRIADSTIAFIENRLILVSRELGNIEGNIQNFKQVNKLADITEQSRLLVTNTSEYIRELSTLETQVSIISALQEYLSDESKNKRVLPSSVIPNDIVFSKLVESYNALLLERDRQMLTSTEDNPFVKNLDQRILTLRNAMLANLASTKKSMEISLGRLQKNINMLGNEIRNVPAHERAFLDMSRQQALKQELYLFLLQKREETALSKTSNFSNSKIIDSPKSAFIPHSPNKIKILLIGLLAGLAIPLGIMYFKELLNDRVQNKDDIIKALPIPVIGEMSHISAGESLIHTNTRSIIAEQFRALRTNLHFFTKNQKGTTILLTSSMQGEGKTFTSINLGTILAYSGKKVLLMDVDLRVAGLSDRLQFKNKAGFTNYIISRETMLSNFIYSTGIQENLFIMPAGLLPPNPSETLMDEKVFSMMTELKKEYDYIILDAPPIGMVADAQLLSQYVSITLYIVRQNYTFKTQLSIPGELYENKKLEKIAVVLNDIKKVNGKSYTYGQYGTVYGEVTKKDNWIQSFKQKVKSIVNI